jgi:hypothetical protein
MSTSPADQQQDTAWKTGTSFTTLTTICSTKKRKPGSNKVYGNTMENMGWPVLF